MAAAQAVRGRPWDPAFTYSDCERWICIYPAYINSKKTIAEGRQVSKSKAVENPLPAEIKEAVIAAGLKLGLESKIYPREVDRQTIRQRIRVQLKNDDGTPVSEKFPTRKALLEYIGETIPKMKTRSQSSSSQQQSGDAGGGKKNKNKKK